MASDLDKVRAIRNMAASTNVTEIRRFLEMVNQLSKFSPHLADETKLLRELLSSKNQWAWGSAQQESFDNIMAKLSSVYTSIGNAAYETRVSADASSYVLGAVLEQKQTSGELKPGCLCLSSIIRNTMHK